MQNFIPVAMEPVHLLLYLFAYILAAIPTSYLVARYIHHLKIDKRQAHSQTASSIYVSLSKISGILVFSLDVMKGLLPCAIAASLLVPVEIIALIGFFAVLGHCFSPWLFFLGGYGGPTVGGCLLIIHWPLALMLFGCNSLFLIIGLSRGLSSILAAFLAGIFLIVMNKVVFLIVMCMTAVMLVRHLARPS